MHLVELREWRNFEALFCAEVAQPNDQNRDAAFLAQREVGDWRNGEFPSLSVLFRSSDSDPSFQFSNLSGLAALRPAGVAPDIISVEAIGVTLHKGLISGSRAVNRQRPASPQFGSRPLQPDRRCSTLLSIPICDR